MTDAYLWMKALHVIGVIAWVAGLLYLPRLYVYHCAAAPGSEASEMLKRMERRLLRYIMNPALALTFLFGILLLHQSGSVDWGAGWIYLKLALVAVLAGMHGLFARWRKVFAEDRNVRSQRFYRIANEVPTVLMIGIVILVVVKPF